MIKFIKKSFYHKNLVFVFLLGLLSSLLIIALGFGVVWYYRANIFGYFAKEYMKDAQIQSIEGENGAKVATERIIEKQSILSQETFVIDAVKKTNPGVVSIIISQQVPKYEAYIDPNQNNNPFGDMFPGFNFNFNIPQ